MSDILFTTITVIILCVYMAFVSVVSEYYRKILTNGKVFKINLAFVMGLALIGVILISRFVTNAGSLYLLMPLLYFALIFIGNLDIQGRYNRHIIMAHKWNMGSEKVKDAKFRDYFWFMMIHFIPLIIPLFLSEVLFGISI